MTQESATLGISGMHCMSCADKIRSALLRLDGVVSAEVSPQSGVAIIVADSTPRRDALRDAVASAGAYALSSVSVSVSVSPGDHEAPALAANPPTFTADERPKESLYPLFLIVGFIFGVTLLIAYATSDWSADAIMRHFMAGFFIVFSFFKLLDLPGFVSAYSGYDLVARKLPAWGWTYPFVELGLGVAYLLAWAPVMTNIFTLVLMLVGAAGVLKALLNKRAIRCACLGTALNLPMTKVTLVEDLTMAAMAAVMLAMLAA